MFGKASPFQTAFNLQKGGCINNMENFFQNKGWIVLCVVLLILAAGVVLFSEAFLNFVRETLEKSLDYLTKPQIY